MGPLTAALGVGVACGYLAAVDPNESGHYPLCPMKALLGWDCPGCGGLRGMHALFRGDPLLALDHNLLLAGVVPGAVVLWCMWVVRAWRGSSPPITARQQRWRTTAIVATAVLVTVFGAVRNFVPYLGSAA